MAEINRAGQNESLGHINTTQGEFREQIDALTDAVRQLGGNAEIAPGTTVVNDPLSAPYVLYVNSYTGKDTFVAGDYASADDGSFEQKMRRISLQRLECGYTEARPFKTINRAIIEAGIITSRDYLNLPGNICGDLVSIVVMPGMHTALNGTGLADNATNFPAYGSTKEFTDAELQSFNPEGSAGIVLPRGCSLVSLDLRKCNIRPNFVPGGTNAQDEAADYSNRGSIFLVTGTGFYYGFTFLDKENYPYTHHLLHTFEFAGRTRTDEFYSKILKSFGSVAGISSTFTKTRNSEVQIVGPAPAPGLQTEATDSVSSASPYIFNCSIRSLYGMGGIFANGANAEGFKSMVTAQYTSIALQKDMRCWQRYTGGNWVDISSTAAGNYDDYIDESPDNVRMDPNKRSFHVRCVNRAIIQEVSVFAIGQGIHHWVESGGELTVTNSNSNFGGCSSLAEGFNSSSFITDKNWNVSSINVARDISGLANKWSRTDLGELAATVSNTATTITLTANLEGSENNKPTLLSRNKNSLDNYGGTSYIWIENPNGVDYYAPLASNAWDAINPNQINVSAAFVSAEGGAAPTTDETSALPPIAGKKIYIRRLQDVRTLDERTYSLTCSNTSADSRNIVRDYGIQTDTLGSTIDTEIGATEPIVVGTVKTLPATIGVFRVNKVEVRRAAASTDWDNKGEYRSGYHLANNYYRTGDVVRYQNKHYKCIVEHIAEATFVSTYWDEVFVHMDETYAAEDFFKNSKPVLIFDRDKDPNVSSTLLGYTNADLGTDAQLTRQLRTSTDYLGVYSFLRSLGFNDADSHTILLPKAPADRERNPNAALDGIGNPSGAANAWDNWPLVMRRPSQIRLFGHAMEWAGYLNYSKALPQYQRDLTPSNKFSFYFTNELGGRVYISAFNEEGFQITAAGLTDLATGSVLSPEGLGGEDVEGEVTIFNNDVTVNGLLTANSIKSDQASLVKDRADNANEFSEGRGMAWIAPMATITGVDTTQGASFDAINEGGQNNGPSNKSGYSGASFVTPYFLDTWRGKNKLLSSTEGPVKIFVNPRAVAPEGSTPVSTRNESRNHNVNSVATLLGQPPTSPGNAVTTLSLAIAYANASLSPTTEIQYYLGPGLYYESGARIFEHDVLLVGYDYGTNQFITDGQGGGAHPWLGTTESGRGNAGALGRFPESTLEAAVQNADNMPVFLTKITREPIFQGTKDRLIISPLRFNFRKNATLQGLMWWGPSETLRAAQGTDAASNTRVKNNWFGTLSAGDLQLIKGETNDKILSAAVFRLFAGTNITGFFNHTPITTNGLLRTRDIAFSAIGLPRQSIGPSNQGPIIAAGSDAVLQLSGISLIGNNHLRSDVTPTGFTGTPPQLNGQDTYKVIGHAQSVVNVNSTTSDSVLSFTPCRFGQRQQNVAGEMNYNLTQFNWHLITSNYTYANENNTMHGSGAPTNENDYGPGFVSFLGRDVIKRRLGRLSYHDFRAPADSHRTGFAGFFGFFQAQVGATDLAGARAMTCSFNNTTRTQATLTINAGNPTDDLPSGTEFEFVDRARFLVRNGDTNDSLAAGERMSGTRPAVVRDNADGYASIDAQSRLNIKFVAARAGLDSNNNFKANRDLLG